MLGYYKQHIIELTKKLRQLEGDQENLDLLLETQLYILKRVISCEEKVDERKNELKVIKYKIKKQRLTKNDSLALKKKAKFIKGRIQEYNWLLYIWRCFGDAIAFIYLDKWAIKPFLYDGKTQNVKQSAGHIKGKEGLYREFSVVLDAKKNGVPAILNDLTNTFRHGDVCLLDAGDPFVLEVKSSTNTNKRTKRQIEEIKNIHNYLENDEGTDVRGAPHCKRIQLQGPEVNYIDLINAQITEALKTGYSSSNPEPGIHYFVLGTGSLPDHEALFSGVEQGIVYMLNQAKNEKAWGCYYPFTLSIKFPENLYKFLKGDICIVVIFDAAKIHELADDRGLEFKLLNEEKWAFRFKKHAEKDEEPITYKVSQHFVARMAFEFLSIEWMFDTDEANIKVLQEQIENQVNA